MQDDASQPLDVSASVALVVNARARDLGDDFLVRRALPYAVAGGGPGSGARAATGMIGPFIFFDHMGPVAMPPGHGLDVRPHPHIALATLTYLFEGEILHRDSLGTELVITPGAVNWMTAGRGIVHSERSPAAARERGARLHGLQLWIALPTADEACEPSFQHHPVETIPRVELPDVVVHVVAGAGWDVTSPVGARSPLVLAVAELAAGATLAVPDLQPQRALYVVDGSVACDGRTYAAGALMVLRPGVTAALHARGAARVVILGGAPLDGERFIEWNFVASARARIDEAKHDWELGRFPLVPGDATERIPLP